MADDDDDIGGGGGGREKVRNPTGNEPPAIGPLYILWENSLEKLKILNYENEFCSQRGRKPFSRIHFVYPGKNSSNQFDEFMELCSWLCYKCSGDLELFKRDPYDDPTTVGNKLMLALRQLDCRLSFPAQKLRTPYGENVCNVLDFLTDKALSASSFRWLQPRYADADIVEMADENIGAAIDDIEDEADGLPEDDHYQPDDNRLEMSEISMDSNARQIHTSQVDPIHWKTELERVGPKLKAKQQLTTNEWRAHVDMTVTNKEQIEKILNETQSDLQAMNREIAEELNKMRSKERYVNNQFTTACQDYKEIKSKLEELEKRNTTANESVVKLTNDLAEITERLEEIKESFESKDSGMNDTSPLVRMKGALQQIKKEIYDYELRIGVVANTVLMARISITQRKRIGAVNNAKKRRQKGKKGSGYKHTDQEDDD